MFLSDKQAEKYLINVPKGSPCKSVSMGGQEYIADKQNYLLTIGLGPCTGIAISVKCDGKVFRFLAHVDMGEIIGNFGAVESQLSNFKTEIINSGAEIEEIDVKFVSSESYRDLEQLSDKEERLIEIVDKFLGAFESVGKNRSVGFERTSRVQISPEGKIYAPDPYRIQSHDNNIKNELVVDAGGYVSNEINAYIMPEGAWMGNTGLSVAATEEEKQEELSNEHWAKFVKEGYKLCLAPSFSDSTKLAVYVENWRDKSIQKYGGVPGCLFANSKRNDFNFDF